MVTFNLSRSASYFDSGIGRGMGFRDSNQDVLGFVHQIPDRARERIIDIASTQFPDGGCYHQYQPLTKQGNLDVGSGFNDDPLWLIAAVAAYLKETGDYGILDELVPFDYDTFAAFPGKVEAGVTNLETGKAEYLEVPRRDDNFLLLQATCAMPLMFPIYRLGGKPYLDGGAAETVPYPRAFEMGCDRAIVILTKPRGFVRKQEKLLPVIERRYREYPNFCQTMRERAERDNRAREELFRLEKEGKVLVLAPEDLRGVSRIERDVEKLRLLWADGYQQGMERMEEIRSFMGR